MFLAEPVEAQVRILGARCHFGDRLFFLLDRMNGNSCLSVLQYLISIVIVLCASFRAQVLKYSPPRC